VDTFVNEDLLQYHDIWAAAGTPFAVFKLTPADLVKLTGASAIAIRS
jgi:prolyl-tRNA editing enzyme YbaK/EbsC (Cys-tRNA(Pro) deacylase)